MKNEKVICDYCKEQVPEKTDMWPTWFGRYQNQERIGTVCKPCLSDDKIKEEWEKGTAKVKGKV